MTFTRAAIVALGLLAASADSASDSASGATDAVVLMYHRFGEGDFPSTSVRMGQFDAHLKHLAAAGYTVVPLADIVATVDGKGRLPERAIAITVDDAYLSVYTEAFPRLRERGWPFTVFVSTDAVDDGGAASMTWEQMREMRNAGVTFANHSATHDSLIERRDGEDEPAWRARVSADLDRAAKRLATELGTILPLFAYPYGEYDSALADLVAERGWAAFGQQSGAIGSHSDRRALPRFPLAESFAAIDDFKTKVAALPLAIARQSPWDPVTADRRPRLEITLATAPKRVAELACYVTGQGRVEPEWLEPGKRFVVRATADLPFGRGRYNCTVPSDVVGRFHWYSQQWVVR